MNRRINLLALDASIEAARAGEVGRVFAVVAENIRELSSATKENVTFVNNVQKIFDEFTAFTQEIKDFSKQIIDSIDLTSKKISEETTSVDSIADVVNSFGGKIDKLNKK
ncbi:methyl-accepting chemotaxis protein [Anaerosinus sp.]|uniref:methyl-accepting chemotaxis protein n=1 Tax=Selenobaculum sp. TaxID=3074374 RepID=UPI003AB207F0